MHPGTRSTSSLQNRAGLEGMGNRGAANARYRFDLDDDSDEPEESFERKVSEVIEPSDLDINSGDDNE